MHRENSQGRLLQVLWEMGVERFAAMVTCLDSCDAMELGTAPVQTCWLALL